MACIITYKNNKYSQQEFEKYFKNNFNEFVNKFLSQDIEGFKKFIQDKQFQKLTQEEKAKTIEQVTKEQLPKLIDGTELLLRNNNQTEIKQNDLDFIFQDTTTYVNNGIILDSKEQKQTEDLKELPFKFKENNEINPFKFTKDKGGYDKIEDRIQSRLITLGVIDKSLKILNPDLFKSLVNSWTNQARIYFKNEDLDKIMFSKNNHLVINSYLFNNYNYENGVINNQNKHIGDIKIMKESGLSDSNIKNYFNNYFNENHYYEDGSYSKSLNVNFNVNSYIRFILKRKETNLDPTMFSSKGQFIDTLNNISLSVENIDMNEHISSIVEEFNKTCK